MLAEHGGMRAPTMYRPAHQGLPTITIRGWVWLGSTALCVGFWALAWRLLAG